MPVFLRQHCISSFFCALWLCAFAAPSHGQEIELIDDNGRAVLLKEPARRVVTLSPHVTELVFAAGGGGKIVATVNSSDFPPEARKLPRVGDGLHPDPEKVASFRPDLIIGWLSDQAEPMEALNIPLFVSAPESLAEIADSIETFGTLLGTSSVARPKADLLRQTIDMLEHAKTNRGSLRAPVRVFIQAGPQADYALGGDHMLSDVIHLCGGVNVFAESASAAPKISPESVLASKPDLVLIGRTGIGATPVTDPEALAYWKSVGLTAARNGQVFMMDADVLYRPGPRLIEAAGALCDTIQRVRQ